VRKEDIFVLVSDLKVLSVRHSEKLFDGLYMFKLNFRHHQHSTCSASSPLYYRAWRLKLVLLYCFAASVATAGGFVLKMSITLGLNWNQQFYLDPVPFHLSFSSPLLLGLQGFWNIHIVALLLLLSRVSSESAFQDYVKPVSYNRDSGVHTPEHNQYDDDDNEQCITHEEYLDRPHREAKYNQVPEEDYLVALAPHQEEAYFQQQQQQQLQPLPEQPESYDSERMPDYAREYFHQEQTTQIEQEQV
jgi:hypothetical protein